MKYIDELTYESVPDYVLIKVSTYILEGNKTNIYKKSKIKQ